MSVAVMNLIWQKSLHKGSALLTLLALADWAADDGTSVYPSMQTLAAKTRLTRRQTISIVSQLEESGVLVWTGRMSPARARIYRIDLAAIGSEKISPSGAGIVKPASPSIVKPTSPSMVKNLHTDSEAGFTQSVRDPSSNPSGVSVRVGAAKRPRPIPGSETRTPAQPASPPVIVPDPPEQIAGVDTAPPGVAPPNIKTQPPPPKTPAQKRNAGDRARQFLPQSLTLYGVVFGQRALDSLPPASRRAVMAAVSEDDDSLARWNASMDAWAKEGNKPGNVTGMLDWYTGNRRIPASGWPRRNGHQQADEPAGFAAIREAMQDPRYIAEEEKKRGKLS